MVVLGHTLSALTLSLAPRGECTRVGALVHEVCLVHCPDERHTGSVLLSNKASHLNRFLGDAHMMSQQPSSSFRADCLCPTAVLTQHAPKLQFEKGLCAHSVWNGSSCSRTGRWWHALSYLHTWLSHSSVLGLVSYLCHIIVLLFKTILGSLPLPQPHHLGFQTSSGLVNLFPSQTSNAPDQPHRYCRLEGALKPDHIFTLTWRCSSRTTPLLHFIL